MLVRAYQHSDLPDVVRCFTQSVRIVTARYYDAQQIDTWAPLDADMASWSERLSRGGVFVADAERSVAGFVRVEPSGLIDLMYVDPAHVRRGVGTELLRAACAWAVANGAKRFEANVSLAARQFFEVAGFRVERDQAVEYKGVTFRNFRMAKEC